MNFIKKYWIILASFAITAIIALILYRWFNKSFVSIIVAIPSLFLSLFINSSREQEKLAKIQIEKFKKDQKDREEEERFRKMLEFVFYSYLNGNDEAIAILDNIFLDEKTKLRDLVEYKIEDKYMTRCHQHYGSHEEQEEGFYKNLSLFSLNQNREKYINILRRELPKILTPDVFDGEKLIIKDE